MDVRLFFLAVSFLTSTAYPLQQGHRESSWTQDANQAKDKSDVTKDQTGVWKSHVESADLYWRAPAMGEKPTLVSERLRARLRQQLAELRARLWPQSLSTPRSVTRMRQLLTPLTEQLQSALSTNTHELCAQLRDHLQQLQPAAPASGNQEPTANQYQAVLAQVGRSLEASVAKVTSSVLWFRAASVSAADQVSDVEERELMLEVTSRLGNEASALEVEFRNRVGSLQASLEGVAVETEGPSSSATFFCQHAQQLIGKLREELESQFDQLEQRGAGSDTAPPTPLRPAFLREDFTARLRALLQEIMQTLN